MTASQLLAIAVHDPEAALAALEQHARARDAAHARERLLESSDDRRAAPRATRATLCHGGAA